MYVVACSGLTSTPVGRVLLLTHVLRSPWQRNPKPKVFFGFARGLRSKPIGERDDRHGTLHTVDNYMARLSHTGLGGWGGGVGYWLMYAGSKQRLAHFEVWPHDLAHMPWTPPPKTLSLASGTVETMIVPLNTHTHTHTHTNCFDQLKMGIDVRKCFLHLARTHVHN